MYGMRTTRTERADLVARRPPEGGVYNGDHAGQRAARLGGALADPLCAALRRSKCFFEHIDVPQDRIIAMATTNAARALGLDGRTGRLAPGCRADVLVVDGNPLDAVDVLRAVRFVLAAGRPHVPQQTALRAAAH
ncbi:amidohydrolase family protein [Streptomyces sp. NPDC091682]|uniref:amidohydrolase family protein n=1 Tax=Streptomyces sp. NPDC091682 TaxID=3366005 RepID=UPI00382D2B54